MQFFRRWGVLWGALTRRRRCAPPYPFTLAALYRYIVVNRRFIEVVSMPTYEYECATCGNDFDVFQSMSDDPLKACPSCGGAVKRVINGGSGVIFKGSGFYKNDSRKTSASSEPKAPEACSSCPASAAGCPSGKDSS
jgi:putative FmdB family regulatory protein